jgi:hypothetical protein
LSLNFNLYFLCFIASRVLILLKDTSIKNFNLPVLKTRIVYYNILFHNINLYTINDFPLPEICIATKITQWTYIT